MLSLTAMKANPDPYVWNHTLRDGKYKAFWVQENLSSILEAATEWRDVRSTRLQQPSFTWSQHFASTQRPSDIK